jgi:iron(III) transport system substrate-binding protein
MSINHHRKNLLVELFAFMIIGLLLGSCVPGENTPQPLQDGNEGQVSGRLVIYSARTEPLIQPVLNAFQTLYPNVDIRLKSGRNSELANALLEERNNPQADVFITTELMTIQMLNNQGIFESYRSPSAELLPPEFVGENNGWTGITRRARVIMYNTDLVPPQEAPKSIFDLTDPIWKGEVAAAGSTNGSMQAQIATMRMLIGDQATEAWLQGLVSNQVTFFGGHTDVRRAVGAGEFKLGLVNHYYYHLQKEEGDPVAMVFPDQDEGQIGLITNATAVAIIKGTNNAPAAQAFVDYLLSTDGQKIFSQLNFEYPLVAGVALEAGVVPLDQFRLADVDVARASLYLDETFALIDKVGLP